MMSEESKAEVVAPEDKVPEPKAEPKAKAPASKRTKAQAEARIRACKTGPELAAVWADLKPEQRYWAAYYETARRIAAGTQEA